jgi:S-adenosylmethionine:tRNA ribosyltransferase-isomerase
MKAAAWPRGEPLAERLLVVDPITERIEDATVGDLPRHLHAGDVLVVNDAATVPASLHTESGAIEMRLLARLGDDATYRALFFGPGDFHTPTEHRPEPPSLAEGTTLTFVGGLHARVLSLDPGAPRLAHIRFDRTGTALFRALYRAGKPIQYSHVPQPLPLWHTQSAFASRPWAFEPPSAGRPLTWGLLRTLLQAGIAVTSVTHAAGISSTGSPALDARLPVPERYFISEGAIDVIEQARRGGGRVVAVGTTVTRALESSSLAHGRLMPGEAEATLVIGPGFRPRVVDGLLTGMHARGTSHFALLEAFAPRPVLERAIEHAEQAGYAEHEFGDSCLVLPRQCSAATGNGTDIAPRRTRAALVRQSNA